MGKLGKMVKLLRMMGYEFGDDLMDPNVQIIEVSLRSTDGKVISAKVTREDLLHQDFIIERIVNEINSQVKDAL